MNHPDDSESGESSLATTGPAWTVRVLPAGMHPALAYLLRRLEEHDGIIAQPVSFRNQTTIRNAAIPAQDSPGRVPVLISNELMRVVSCCPEADQASLIRDRQIANAQSRIGESMLTRIVRHAFHDVNSKVGASPRFVQLLLDAGADPLVCCDSGKNVIHDLIWSAVPDEVEEEAAVMERSSKIFESVLRSAGRAGMLSLLLCADRHGTTPCEYFKTEKHTNWQELLESVVTYRAVKRPRSHPLTEDQSFPKIARTAAVVQPTKKRTLEPPSPRIALVLGWAGEDHPRDGLHDGQAVPKIDANAVVDQVVRCQHTAALRNLFLPGPISCDRAGNSVEPPAKPNSAPVKSNHVLASDHDQLGFGLKSIQDPTKLGLSVMSTQMSPQLKFRDRWSTSDGPTEAIIV